MVDLTDVTVLDFGAAVLRRMALKPPVNACHANYAFELLLHNGARQVFVSDAPAMRVKWVDAIRSMLRAISVGAALPGHVSDSDLPAESTDGAVPDEPSSRAPVVE